MNHQLRNAVGFIAAAFLINCAPSIQQSKSKQEDGFTIVEVNVDPPLLVNVYAHHPSGGLGLRICSQVSKFAKCKFPWSVASPSSGVILRVKPLAYPDCPLVRPELVSERCYNTDIIYFQESSIIVLNVRHPLQFSSYFLKEPN